MPMNYEELDDTTRRHMVAEFESEQRSANPFRSKALCAAGHAAFPEAVRRALETGNEQSLFQSLHDPKYWEPKEKYERNGVVRERQRNIRQAAERLALTEFSTWYVRGLAARLLGEGVEQCQVYRGAQPKWEPGECAQHEGMIVPVRTVYDGHRARYWPEPGNPDAFSIPFGPGCHHVIRTVG